MDETRLAATLAITLSWRHDPTRLMADLLDGLILMLRAGHVPSSYLLIRLTDGRGKAFRTAAGRQAEAQVLREIQNEFGPVGFAFEVGVERLAVEGWEGQPAQVRAGVRNLLRRGPAGIEQDLLRHGAEARAIGTPRWLTRAEEAPQSEVESRNAAIFAASLGITTGRLANVDSSLPPSGASSSPVW